jgi:methionyl-tRNA synthetase
MSGIFLQHSWIVVVIILWSIPWKGVALWKSAKNSHLGWFIALLIINSLAILDILYIFIFSKLGAEKQQNANLPVQLNPNPVRKNNIV